MAVLLQVLLMQPVGAQQAAPGGGASCFAGVTPLAPADLATFKANPGSLLTDFPRGGLGLADRVLKILAADPDSAATVLATVKSASLEQKASVGSGLGRGASACVTTDPKLAENLQKLVAETADAALIASFVSASKGPLTASVGVGGGAAIGGGVGGSLEGGGSDSGGARSFGTYPSPNYFTNSGYSFSFNSNGGSSTVIDQSVSPTQ